MKDFQKLQVKRKIINNFRFWCLVKRRRSLTSVAGLGAGGPGGGHQAQALPLQAGPHVEGDQQEQVL